MPPAGTLEELFHVPQQEEQQLRQAVQERTYKGLNRQQLHCIFEYIKAADFDPVEVVRSAHPHSLHYMLQFAEKSSV